MLKKQRNEILAIGKFYSVATILKGPAVSERGKLKQSEGAKDRVTFLCLSFAPRTFYPPVYPVKDYCFIEDRISLSCQLSLKTVIHQEILVVAIFL